jgi:hypothetical protein
LETKPCRNTAAGTIAGTLRSDGYIGIYINKKYHMAHRVIWEMFSGEIEGGLFVDHIDMVRDTTLSKI